METDQHEQLIIPLPIAVGQTWKISSRLDVIESRTFAKEDRILTTLRSVSMIYKITGMSEMVSVKAGYFTDCLKVEGVGKTTVPVDRHNGLAQVKISTVDWYAPGVGLIRSERVEESESSFLKTGFFTLELLKVEE